MARADAPPREVVIDSLEVGALKVGTLTVEVIDGPARPDWLRSQ